MIFLRATDSIARADQRSDVISLNLLDKKAAVPSSVMLLKRNSYFFTSHRLVRSECTVRITFHKICFCYSTDRVGAQKSLGYIREDVGTDFLNILRRTNRCIYNHRCGSFSSIKFRRLYFSCFYVRSICFGVTAFVLTTVDASAFVRLLQEHEL